MALKRLGMLWLALLWCGGDALALGVATPRVSSSLNEPLTARVPLVDSGALRADDIDVSLADESAFQALGLSRSAATDTLRFEVAGTPGDLYIDIRGRLPLDEAMLEAVLTLRWASGSMMPQITLLPRLAPSDRGTAIAAPADTRPEGSLAALADPLNARRAPPVPAPSSVDAELSAQATAAAIEAMEAETSDVSASAEAPEAAPEVRRGLESLAMRLNDLEERLQAQGMAQVSLASRLSALTLSPEMIEAFEERQQQLATRLDRLDERFIPSDARLADAADVSSPAGAGAGRERSPSQAGSADDERADESRVEDERLAEAGERTEVASSASTDEARSSDRPALDDTPESGTESADDTPAMPSAAAGGEEDAGTDTLLDRLSAFWWLIALFLLLAAVGTLRLLRHWRERGYHEVSVDETGLTMPAGGPGESDESGAVMAAASPPAPEGEALSEETPDPARVFENAQARAICDEAAIFARHGRHEQARALLSAGLESYPDSTLLARALEAQAPTEEANTAEAPASPSPTSPGGEPPESGPGRYGAPVEAGRATGAHADGGSEAASADTSALPTGGLALLSPQEIEIDEAQKAASRDPRAALDEIDTSGYHLTEFEYGDKPSIVDDDSASAAGHNATRGMLLEALERDGEARSGEEIGSGEENGAAAPGLAFSRHDTDNDAPEAAPQARDTKRRRD